MAWSWRLLENACTGCGICADVCPHDAIHMPHDLALPQAIERACTGCMICVKECPFRALVVRRVEELTKL